MFKIKRVTTRPRRLLSLGMLVLFGAILSGWVSPWLGVLAVALGIADVVLDRNERRQSDADDPAVLDLHS